MSSDSVNVPEMDKLLSLTRCRGGRCGYGSRRREEKVVVDAMVVDVETELEDVRRRRWWWMLWLWIREEEEEVVDAVAVDAVVVDVDTEVEDRMCGCDRQYVDVVAVDMRVRRGERSSAQ
ncbi:hypothetical protein HID58_091069, partial [Brassica napus]